jgi:hypothetical protein
MPRRKKNPHIGSSLESFLKEEGIYETATLKALKTVIAWQLAQEMKRRKVTKTRMAQLMATSRAQLDRVLDNDSDVTIGMLTRAAAALNKEVTISLR